MLKKRIIFIVLVIIITVSCYIFMNRNFDPLARYSYEIDEMTREKILSKMDEREIKYIVDYEIDYNDFIGYIDAYRFNVYHTEHYNKAKYYLYRLNNMEIVDVVEKILDKNLDFESCLSKFSNYDYSTIVNYELKKVK